VGIVKDIRTRGPARPVMAEVFMPYEQHQGPATSLNLVIRTDAADPVSIGATAARQIRSRNPEVPVKVETMEMAMAVPPPRRGSGPCCWWCSPLWRSCSRSPASMA
ncbi:MAG TPA: hypothetical protein VNT81_19955, partial [Vicinamibacterales bacterium]|nr:hypothetical protein [Vicinamibacterales bacterium]